MSHLLYLLTDLDLVSHLFKNTALVFFVCERLNDVVFHMVLIYSCYPFYCLIFVYPCVLISLCSSVL